MVKKGVVSKPHLVAGGRRVPLVRRVNPKRLPFATTLHGIEAQRNIVLNHKGLTHGEKLSLLARLKDRELDIRGRKSREMYGFES